MGTRNARGGHAPLDLAGIDWVIVGGESGPGARPFYLEHAREIIRACGRERRGCRSIAACGGLYTDGTCPLGLGVTCEAIPKPAVFVKQLGSRPLGRGYIPTTHGPNTFSLRLGEVPLKLRNRKGGDINEWPRDLRVRDFPRSAT